MTGPHRRPARDPAVGAGRSARRLLAIVTLSGLFALPGIERAAWADSHASSTDGYVLECPDQHRSSGNYRVIAGETFRVTLYTNRNIGVFDRMTGAFTTQAVDSSSVGRFALHDQVKTDGGRGKERVGFDIETYDECDFGRLDDRFRMKAAEIVGVQHRGTLQCTITILDDNTFPWRRRDSFEVRARSAAGDGPPSNRVTATPLPAPVLASIEITPDAGSNDTYAIGDRIVATVTFDRTIQVDTQGGSPTLALTIGNGTGKATCAASADPKQLECTYTVAEGDGDSDGVSIGANRLALNGGHIYGIYGSIGGGATLAHSALGSDGSHQVDGVRPAPVNASLNGTELKIEWRETLDTGSEPAPPRFVLGVNSGTAPTVSSLAMSGAIMTLTFSSAADATRKYTLAYTAPQTFVKSMTASNFSMHVIGRWSHSRHLVSNRRNKRSGSLAESSQPVHLVDRQ